jgi:ribonuclease J
MIELTKPEIFKPIHGEPHHLATNKRLAEEMGVEPDNVRMIRNGDSMF